MGADTAGTDAGAKMVGHDVDARANVECRGVDGVEVKTDWFSGSGTKSADAESTRRATACGVWELLERPLDMEREELVTTSSRRFSADIVVVAAEGASDDAGAGGEGG